MAEIRSRQPVDADLQAEIRLDVPFTVVNLVTTALSAVLPFFFHSTSSIIAFLGFYVVTGLGLTLGYHRMFAHRAFRVPRWLERTIAVCGYLAIQRGPLFWVAMHRMHHRHTDVPGLDPHTPKEGWWHVHFGWMQRRRPDVWTRHLYHRWVPDLRADPFYGWLDSEQRDYATYAVLLSLSWMIGGVVGGFGSPSLRFDTRNAWCFLVWVGLLNRVAVLHAFGLINSVCHTYGSRPFRTHGADTSVNNGWVAALIFGEGWHNNHHAFPRSARQGLRWYQWDPAWYGIALLRAVGLASDVKVPTANDRQRRAIRSEAGSAERKRT